MHKIVHIIAFILLSFLISPTILGKDDVIIKVRGDKDFPPFEYIDENGNLTGFNYELLKMMLNNLGICYEIQLQNWSDVIEDYKQGEVDIVIGVSILHDWIDNSNFGLPTCQLSINIISRKKDEYRTMPELKGKKILVQKGDWAHDYLLKNHISDYITAVDDIYSAISNFDASNFDAVLSSDILSKYVIKKERLKSVVSIPSHLNTTDISFLVHDNPELLLSLNKELLNLRLNGEYDKLYKKWISDYDDVAISKSTRNLFFILSSIIIFFIFLTFYFRKRVQIATKKLEIAKNKAIESDNLKSTFLANMSHEIRTPLNTIIGFSNLLKETDSKEEKEDYSKIIASSGDNLIRIIDEILDLSKIEAGFIELKPIDFDLSSLFNLIHTTFKQKIPKNIEFIYKNPCESYMVHMDKNRLTQVITNFMTNAIKFTSNGSITLGYEIIDNDSYKIFVSDTGIGISKEKQKKVFDKFERVNDFGQGTGLGLPICKSIVEKAQGTIGFNSTVGKGSTFWAILPKKLQ